MVTFRHRQATHGDLDVALALDQIREHPILVWCRIAEDANSPMATMVAGSPMATMVAGQMHFVVTRAQFAGGRAVGVGIVLNLMNVGYLLIRCVLTERYGVSDDGDVDTSPAQLHCSAVQ